MDGNCQPATLASFRWVPRARKETWNFIEWLKLSDYLKMCYENTLTLRIKPKKLDLLSVSKNKGGASIKEVALENKRERNSGTKQNLWDKL